MIIGYPQAKMEIEPLTHATYKTNSKWIKNLYTRAKILKILENIGIKFCDFGLGKFLDMTLKLKKKKGITLS